MKKRMPNDIEDAVAQVIGLIGAEAASQVIERSASLVYKYSDPDHTAKIGLAQAMLLDAACQAKHGETPFFDFYKNMMERNARRLEATENQSCALAGSVMHLSKAVGDVAGLVAQFTTATSEDGAALSLNERATLAESLRVMTHAVDALDDSLNPNTPFLAKG
tara:strand:+ start:56 stop:544 length:489 start_codon:yes stop_codon:yes gene_type:complete